MRSKPLLTKPKEGSIVTHKEVLHVARSPTLAKNPDFASPQPTNASKSKVSEFAEKVAQNLKFRPGAALEPIVEQLGGEISYRSRHSVEEGDASLIVKKKGSFQIFLSSTTGMERDRFSIAHELGHYFLHYIVKKMSTPMRATRFGNDRVEWEANWFAGAFLMPEADFRSAFERFSKDLDRIAAHFDVSRMAAEIRSKNLHLAPA